MVALQGLPEGLRQPDFMFLTFSFSDRDQIAAQILLQTLLEVPGRGRIAVFRAHLESDDRIVVARAAVGLGQAGAVEVAPRLVELLENDDAYLRQSILEALGALASADAAPALLAFLQTLIDGEGSTHSRNAYHVRLAIEALGAAGHRPAANLFVRLVKARGRFAEPAAIALSRIGGDAARAAIAKILEERGANATAREFAVALARLGDTAPLAELHRQDMAVLASGVSESRALGQAADSAIRLGKTERALEIARRRVTGSPEDANARYDLACILALAGQAEASLKALEEAAARGYANSRQLARDPDLRVHHASAEFRVILARVNRR